LAHEWSHIRRKDLWLLAAGRVLAIVLWPNPLYWWFRQRVRLDQETLADADAADIASRNLYAEQLVAWARNLNHASVPRLASAVGFWEGRSQLRRRVALLLDDTFTVHRQVNRAWRGIVAATGIAIATGLSLATLEP